MELVVLPCSHCLHSLSLPLLWDVIHIRFPTVTSSLYSTHAHPSQFSYCILVLSQVNLQSASSLLLIVKFCDIPETYPLCMKAHICRFACLYSKKKRSGISSVHQRSSRRSAYPSSPTAIKNALRPEGDLKLPIRRTHARHRKELINQCLATTRYTPPPFQGKQSCNQPRAGRTCLMSASSSCCSCVSDDARQQHVR